MFRRAQLVAAVILAFVRGLFRRSARRLFGHPPRVWFGYTPLHATRYTAMATRLAGFPTRSVVTATGASKRYDLVTQRDFDVVISDRGVPWNEVHWHALADLLLHGDLWIAYFDALFFPAPERRANELVFTLLRLAGIRIIAITHGSDIVRLSPQRTRFDWIERMQRDYPTWDFGAQTIISHERIRLFMANAALLIAPYPALRRLLPRCDLMFTPFPIDLREISEAPRPSNRVPLILHAPNHRYVKGTDALIAAVDRLHERGIECELRLVEGVSREKALQVYGDADIIVDQLIVGAFGVFAVEAMALGRPVVTYLDQEVLGDPVFNFPLVNAHPENAAAVVAALVQLPELRARLGHASRASVERHLSPEALAEVWKIIGRHVWYGEPLALEQTAHFSRDRKPRAFTEDPSRAEFWPVEVSDLLPRIREALSRVSS